MSDESAEWHAEAMRDGAKASCLLAISVEDIDAASLRLSLLDGTSDRRALHEEVMKRAHELFCS